jgi:hypothetical protein
MLMSQFADASVKRLVAPTNPNCRAFIFIRERSRYPVSRYQKLIESGFIDLQTDEESARFRTRSSQNGDSVGSVTRIAEFWLYCGQTISWKTIGDSIAEGLSVLPVDVAVMLNLLSKLEVACAVGVGFQRRLVGREADVSLLK